MALPKQRHTLADLYAMPESERGERYELIDGELVVSPPPVWRHQMISTRLAAWLTMHVDSEGLGWVNSGPGVAISSRTYLIPDVVFVSRERGDIIDEAGIEGAPDLAIEILSPKTRRHDLLTKRAQYAQLGVREYWIIDPDALTIDVLALADGVYHALPQPEPGIIRSQVLPALRLSLPALFRDLGDGPQ
ncbi:MAG: Uma2 family endonuclease [Thermomicrobiales bacterium]